ncbi:MAG TPA: cache domain-containing protein [Candidatus Saccharicenans sp.]|jgi:two-component system NtrC family sensor kinase|nr:cache domain-containing protein [Candidatus Saccharicenans sp.]HRD02786.1 cache domain-containing protein [Candidatus Saccharicenans sp.]
MNLKEFLGKTSALRSSLRFKLTSGLLTIVFLMGALSIYIGINSINRNVIREAYDNLRNSLKAISDLYQEEINTRSKIVEYLSRTSEIVNATAAGNREYLYEKLVQIKEEFGFDIVNVVKPDGTILVRANNFEAYGDSVNHYKFIQWVLKNRQPAAGTGILGYENIKNEGPDLAERTLINVIPTPRARTMRREVEERALVLKTVVPIFQRKKLVGVLYAAVLLNNNERFIDRFKRLIFKEERIRGKDVGTITIFLDDVRIATNVLDEEGKRAVGTMVSEEVYDQVFEQGQDWLGRAFVVNDYYLSGYTLLRDIEGQPVGMLYVGILQAKFDQILRQTTLLYFVLIFLMTGIAIYISTYLVNVYTRPINRMIKLTADVASGNYHLIDISPEESEEIKEVEESFNAMVKAIEERDNRLKELAEKTILRSEKLASLGRLAAGIAHEINNPLTGILTYSSLLLEELKGTAYEEDLKVITEETLRCRKIVRGLLDFARDYKPEEASVNLNILIEETMQILENHVNFQNIKIVKHLDQNLPKVKIDADEFRSVINNLAVNAADAMPNGGQLTISTAYDSQHRQVIIRVADTGVGINKENLKRIFEPFFTTKEKGKGTGLGLAMAYGAIKRHNGTIDVKSKVGEGTEFIIILPVE